MDALAHVKDYMEFWGWTAGGAPGSVKVDDDGVVIAKHGDAVWIANVSEACDILGKLADQVAQAHIKVGDDNG